MESSWYDGLGLVELFAMEPVRILLLIDLVVPLVSLTVKDFYPALQAVKSHRHAKLKLNIICEIANQPVMARVMMTKGVVDQAVGLDKSITEEDSLIYCLNNKREESKIKHMLQSSNTRYAVNNVWLMIGTTVEVDRFSTSVTVDIGRFVYFLDTSTGQLTETYKIAKKRVNNVLGQVRQEGGSIDWLSDKNVLKRRADFHGLQFKAGSHPIGAPLVSYTNEARKHFQWTKDRKGSLVADVTDETDSGAFVEVMDVLQGKLNFSMSKIVRKDADLGFPRFINGTFVGYSGLIGDLLSKDINFIMAPMRHVIERYKLMDFLHGISTYTNSILANADAGNEEQEWLTYLLPFRPNLWLLLFGNSLCAAFAIGLVLFLYSSKKPNCVSVAFESLGYLWMILMSYFGKPSTSQSLWLIRSTKILLFFIFLSGNLVFMFYKAGLTTELSIKAQKLPFTTPKGLYDSKFKVIHIYSQIDRIFKQFGRYPAMRWIGKSYYERGHSNSFFGSYEAALEALAGPHSQTALFSFAEKYYAFPKYRCIISVAWRKRRPVPLTMSLPKGSPYHKIMNNVHLKGIDSGLLSRTARRHYGQKDITCPVTLKGAPLGSFKVLGAYIAFISGASLSVALLILEVCWALIGARLLFHNRKLVDLDEDEKGYGYIFDHFCQTWGPTSFHPRHQKMFLSELHELLHSK